MKECQKCQVSKPLTEFYKQSRTKDGHRPICKACESEIKKQYYTVHRQRLKEYGKTYYLENKDKVNIKGKKYRARMFNRNYVKNMLRRAEARAQKKGIEFNLTPEQILIPEYCPILRIKLEPSQGRSGGHDFSPSLDRIDTSKGYTPENIQVISNLANTMKNSATIEQLVLFAQWVLSELTETAAHDTIRSTINNVKGV